METQFLVRLLTDRAPTSTDETVRQSIQDFESASAASPTPMLPSGAMPIGVPTNPFGTLASPNLGIGQTTGVGGSVPAAGASPSTSTTAQTLQRVVMP